MSDSQNPKIITPDSSLLNQGEFTEFPKVSMSKRINARFIDEIIVGLGCFVIPLTFLISKGKIYMNLMRNINSLEGLIISAIFCWSIFYLLCHDALPGGQSYGKRLLGLMVVDLTTNQPCTYRQSIIRNLAGIATLAWLNSYFEDNVARYKRDIWAGTQVVSVLEYSNVTENSKVSLPLLHYIPIILIICFSIKGLWSLAVK